MSAEVAVRLRMASGVPVIDVYGEWGPYVSDSLAEIVFSLIAAGHFEIVLNVRKAAMHGISALMSLKRAVQSIRQHCGHIDVVATAGQWNELQKHGAHRVFRLATSEAKAIGRIKRIPILMSNRGSTARTAG